MPKCSDCGQYKSQGLDTREHVGGQGDVWIFTCQDCIDLKKIAYARAYHEGQAEFKRLGIIKNTMPQLFEHICDRLTEVK